MPTTVELAMQNKLTGEVSRVSIPVRYVTRDWAVHRPQAFTRKDGTLALYERGWRVTCRHSGRHAWSGTNLQEAKKAARALQAASDAHGRIPADGRAPEPLLRAHAIAVGHPMGNA